MKSDAWHANRNAAEKLLIALGKATPEALQTLQDHELERVIVFLTRAVALCGAERSIRTEQARKTPEE